MILKNGMEIIIRKATEEDASAILSYLNIVGGESDNLSYGCNEFNVSVQDEQQYINKVNESKTSAFFIGMINDEIVSIGCLLASSRERLAHNGELNLTVKKMYWKNGIGEHMLETIIEFAKSNGTTKIIHLRVNSDNHAAISLYKKVGFEVVGENKKYLLTNGEKKDSIIMNLFLN